MASTNVENKSWFEPQRLPAENTGTQLEMCPQTFELGNGKALIYNNRNRLTAPPAKLYRAGWVGNTNGVWPNGF